MNERAGEPVTEGASDLARRRVNWMLLALAPLVAAGVWLAVADVAARPAEARRASGGVLDLRALDFERDGAAPLLGEWGFHWKRLLDPALAFEGPPPAVMVLPGTWRSAQVPGETTSGRGFATHTLRLLLPDEAVGRELGLTIGELSSASRLYLDGDLVRVNGEIGTSPETEVPSARPGYVRFTPKGAELLVVLQLSNFFHYDGGPAQVMDLGLAQRSEAAIARASRLDYLVMGSAGIFGVFCAFLFAARPTDRSHALFALLSFFILLRIATVNWYLVELFPELSDQVQIWIDYLTDFVMPVLYYVFLRSLYPAEFGARFLRLEGCYSILGVACTIALPAHLYTWLRTSVEINAIVVLAVCFTCLMRAGLKNRDGARFLAINTLIVTLVIGHDIARRENVVHLRRDLFPYGLILLICSHGVTLGSRLSRALNTSERLSGELTDLNRSLEERVRERTAELDRLAGTDALTGLLNRRSFLERAEAEHARAARHGHELAALMLDVDHFKKINDSHGHETGDRVLQAIAASFSGAVRTHDLVGRFGGEEFVLLLPHSDRERSTGVAERLRERIGELEIRSPAGERILFTASLGVALLAKGESIQKLLRRADEALYAAKAAGRNAVREA